MKIIFIVLVCIGLIYSIYSLVDFIIKIKKSKKYSCIFEASKLEWVIHGSGIFLLFSATVIYYKSEVEGWLFFFCLLCEAIVNFIVRNTKICK